MNAWRRNVERVDDAEEQRQHHDCHVVTLPVHTSTASRQRLEHLQRLRPHDQATLVHAVHDDAATR